MRDIAAALSEETLRAAYDAWNADEVERGDDIITSGMRAAAAKLVPEVARLIGEAMTSDGAIAAAMDGMRGRWGSTDGTRRAILAALAHAVPKTSAAPSPSHAPVSAVAREPVGVRALHDSDGARDTSSGGDAPASPAPQGTPPRVEPCPDGDACPDARRHGAVHPKPTPPRVEPTRVYVSEDGSEHATAGAARASNAAWCGSSAEPMAAGVSEEEGEAYRQAYETHLCHNLDRDGTTTREDERDAHRAALESFVAGRQTGGVAAAEWKARALRAEAENLRIVGEAVHERRRAERAEADLARLRAERMEVMAEDREALGKLARDAYHATESGGSRRDWADDLHETKREAWRAAGTALFAIGAEAMAAAVLATRRTDGLGNPMNWGSLPEAVAQARKSLALPAPVDVAALRAEVARVTRDLREREVDLNACRDERQAERDAAQARLAEVERAVRPLVFAASEWSEMGVALDAGRSFGGDAVGLIRQLRDAIPSAERALSGAASGEEATPPSTAPAWMRERGGELARHVADLTDRVAALEGRR